MMFFHRHRWQRYTVRSDVMPLVSTVTLSMTDAHVTPEVWGRIVQIRKWCACGKDRFVRDGYERQEGQDA